MRELFQISKIWKFGIRNPQAEIAERVGVDRTIVTKFMQEISKKYQENQMDIFRNFKPEIYTVWKFPPGARG